MAGNGKGLGGGGGGVGTVGRSERKGEGGKLANFEGNTHGAQLSKRKCKIYCSTHKKKIYLRRAAAGRTRATKLLNNTHTGEAGGHTIWGRRCLQCFFAQIEL